MSTGSLRRTHGAASGLRPGNSKPGKQHYTTDQDRRTAAPRRMRAQQPCWLSSWALRSTRTLPRLSSSAQADPCLSPASRVREPAPSVGSVSRAACRRSTASPAEGGGRKLRNRGEQRSLALIRGMSGRTVLTTPSCWAGHACTTVRPASPGRWRTPAEPPAGKVAVLRRAAQRLNNQRSWRRRTATNDACVARGRRATLTGKTDRVAPATSPSVFVVSSDTPAFAIARSTGSASACAPIITTAAVTVRGVASISAAVLCGRTRRRTEGGGAERTVHRRDELLHLGAVRDIRSACPHSCAPGVQRTDERRRGKRGKDTPSEWRGQPFKMRQGRASPCSAPQPLPGVPRSGL